MITEQDLIKYVDFLIKEVKNASANGEIEEIILDEDILVWRLEKLDYTLEQGISAKMMHGNHEKIKLSKFKHKLIDKIKNNKEYTKFRELLVDSLKNNPDFILGRFSESIINSILKKEEVSEYIKIFINELNNEPILIKGIVKLDGLTIEPDNIQVSKEIKIRRPTKEDIEFQELLGNPFRRGFGFEFPTAIMEVSIYSNRPVELQMFIEKLITILRLYKISCVRYLEYRIKSDTFLNLGGGSVISSTLDYTNNFIGTIYNTEIEKFKIFVLNFHSELKDLVFERSDSATAYLNFAYERYSEALLTKTIFEQRMASAIMGLESLFLNNNQEINRYLRLRIAKFLSLAKLKNPKNVIKVLKDAYNVRSLFVHGNKLNYNDKKKIIDKYSSEQNLLKEVLDYLRVSLILLLLMKRQKDELIDNIDEAFIDRKKEDELSTLLENLSNRLNLITQNKFY